MNETRDLDENGFPVYPEIRPLPALPSRNDRLRFAFQLADEHGEGLDDYIFAQFRLAPTAAEMVRWEMLSQLIEEIIGRPLQVSYDVQARLACEGINVAIQEDYYATGSTKRLPDC